ncbi:MAG: right-handed parallel beta-helix repeat-containing protein, partial [Verrucomicrobia bacterium]|nr:right-handed parallel beta-helix repeat-containing protein [Verrucomicrobiota bacterium]
RTDYNEAIRVWGGPLLVEGNLVFNNDSTGIAGTTLVTIRGNTVFSNGGDGIFVEGAGANASEAVENRVFLNNGTGISISSGSPARRNVVYANKGHGIYVDGYEGNFTVIANNLCYQNGDAADEFNIMLPRQCHQPQ